MINNITPQSIGDRIKISREKLGLSQSEVSRAMFLSRGVCGQWERGVANPSTQHLAKLANMLEVSFEYLAIGDDRSNDVIRFSSVSDKNIITEKILKVKMNTLFAKLSTQQKQSIINFLDSMINQ